MEREVHISCTGWTDKDIAVDIGWCSIAIAAKTCSRLGTTEYNTGSKYRNVDRIASSKPHGHLINEEGDEVRQRDENYALDEGIHSFTLGRRLSRGGDVREVRDWGQHRGEFREERREGESSHRLTNCNSNSLALGWLFMSLCRGGDKSIFKRYPN